MMFVEPKLKCIISIEYFESKDSGLCRDVKNGGSAIQVRQEICKNWCLKILRWNSDGHSFS